MPELKTDLRARLEATRAAVIALHAEASLYQHSERHDFQAIGLELRAMADDMSARAERIDAIMKGFQ